MNEQRKKIKQFIYVIEMLCNGVYEPTVGSAIDYPDAMQELSE
jgi:hypothetical protein